MERELKKMKKMGQGWRQDKEVRSSGGTKRKG